MLTSRCPSLPVPGCAIGETRTIEINVWDAAPGSDAVKDIPGIPFEFVTPKLTVILPPAHRCTGAMILVIPGGGYLYCTADGEGFEVAEQLLARGIAVGVLQYRRNIFLDENQKRTRVYEENVALEDAVRSMRIIRSHAEEWGILPDRIGVMGFSAGGHVAATMSVHPEKGDPDAADPLGKFPTRPDFMILAYPLISMAPPWAGAIWRDNLLGEKFDPESAEYYSCQKHVTAETPPAFIVCCGDDFTVEDSLAMYRAMKAGNVPCELHIFEKGGHGYGMTTPDLTVTKYWPELLDVWLKGRGVIPTENSKQKRN